MPTETATTNERVTREAGREVVRSRDDEGLRKLALRHLENVRKFKLYLAIYVLSMVILTPVWIITQYETQDGWLEHLSSRSRYPGDWDPWLIWVGLVGAVLVAIAGFRAYFSKADTEADIEREIERLRSRR